MVKVHNPPPPPRRPESRRIGGALHPHLRACPALPPCPLRAPPPSPPRGSHPRRPRIVLTVPPCPLRAQLHARRQGSNPSRSHIALIRHRSVLPNPRRVAGPTSSARQGAEPPMAPAWRLRFSARAGALNAPARSPHPTPTTHPQPVRPISCVPAPGPTVQHAETGAHPRPRSDTLL